MVDPSDDLALSSQPGQSLQGYVAKYDNSFEDMEIDEGGGGRNVFDIISYCILVDKMMFEYF